MTCGSPSAWQVSRAAITASGEQQARSESGPAGSSQSRSVTPIGFRPGAEERDGAVDAAAHRDGDPLGVVVGAEDLRERIRERVGRERLAGDGGRLEQRQPGERPGHSGRVGLDDPVAVDDEPDERELLAARGVSDNFEHLSSLATKTPASPAAAGGPFRGLRDGKSSTLPMYLAPMRTCLSRWVPCRTSTGEV